MNKKKYIVPDAFILSACEMDVLVASPTQWFIEQDGEYGLDDKSFWGGPLL